MSITPTAQDLLRPEPKRDRWGRYLVADPKGGKGKGYTRVTTLTKTCSDTHGLTEWIKRVVAVGIAKRPDLIAEAANLTVDDKGPLKEIIAATPPPVRGGKQPRILFATQATARPPTFVLFSTGFLEAGYRRFLERRLRETFGFEGTPIRINVRVREKRKTKPR